MDSHLTQLVPSTPYALAYTLPLLIFSVLLLFAGSFLTLDRTRSFPPQSTDPAYSSLPGTFDLKRKKPKFTWLLGGGVGGLGFGFVFGVHLSTFLSLLIPATSSASPLSPKSFLAVWILCTIPTTFLGGRYRHAALVFAGIGGGTAIALGFALILHPSLLPRQILLAVFALLLLVLILVSSLIPHLSIILLRPVLRTASSALGAFGLVLCIALLSKPPVSGWANVWERLWVKNGDPQDWGTGKEKGLSAAWAVFWVVGIVVDWALRRWVGECPDEKWDSYLSKYATDLPNHPDRAGTFQPLQSFWDKLFSSSAKHSDDAAFFLGPPPPKGEKSIDDMIFPSSDKDPKHPRFAGEGRKVPGDALDAYYSIPPPLSTSPQFKLGKAKKAKNAKVDLNAELEDVAVPSGVAFLRKKSEKRWKGLGGKKKKGDGKGGRKPVKFGTVDELSSSSSSESEDEKTKGDVEVKDAKEDEEEEDVSSPTKKPKRPWVVTNHQHSYSSDVSTAPTLVEGRGKSYPPPPAFPVPKTPSVPQIAAPQTTVPRAPNPAHDTGVDIDYDKELERLQSHLRGKDSSLVYSSDEDVSSPRTRRRRRTPSPTPQSDNEWSPAFLRRHSAHRRHTADPEQEDDVEMVVPPVPGAMPVPATPSLIRAVDRIVVAQREVFGKASTPAKSTPSPLHRSGERERGADGDEDIKRLRVEESPITIRDGGEKARQQQNQSWDAFWRDVRVKAGQN
ncbi:hypothetical protein H1R20_g10488, partial [Candolleomyces eurysporus]